MSNLPGSAHLHNYQGGISTGWYCGTCKRYVVPTFVQDGETCGLVCRTCFITSEGWPDMAVRTDDPPSGVDETGWMEQCPFCPMILEVDYLLGHCYRLHNPLVPTDVPVSVAPGTEQVYCPHCHEDVFAWAYEGHLTGYHGATVLSGEDEEGEAGTAIIMCHGATCTSEGKELCGECQHIWCGLHMLVQSKEGVPGTCLECACHGRE